MNDGDSRAKHHLEVVMAAQRGLNPVVRLIGIEEHWIDARLDDALRRLSADRADLSLALNDWDGVDDRLRDLGDDRLAAMDAQGVDLQVLSVASPGTHPLNPADAVPLARDANDRIAAVVAARPDRLAALTTLLPGDPAAAAVELDRAAGLGLAGAMVYGRTGHMPLDDPAVENVRTVAQQPAQHRNRR